MRNIRINEAESIFEVLWNSAEPGKQKYDCFDEWNTEWNGMGYRIDGIAEAMQLEMLPGNEYKPFPCRIERECELDISEYDRIVLRSNISPRIKFRMTCCIDGQEQEVLFSAGTGNIKKYEAPIQGSIMTLVRLEFENLAASREVIRLSYLGLANTAMRKVMLERKSPYTPDWPGCFAKEPQLTPQVGLYFGPEELEELREKLTSPGFVEGLEELRRTARRYMNIVPENWIRDYVCIGGSMRAGTMDQGRPDLLAPMQILSFVGLIDEDIEMLRLACRMALSVCHCRSFTDSFLLDFPGVTWHHRCFCEGSVCKAVIRTLDWAGGLLSWHGQDLIYEALMMKGLYRMDMDLKITDDIWYTNQGFHFSASLMGVLITLARHYPRYHVRVKELEQDIMTMWKNYVHEDGGITEGGSYWHTSMTALIESMMLLARYYGKSLEEYVPASVKRTADYVKAIMSTIDHSYIPYNDTNLKAGISQLALNFLAQIGCGDYWKAESNRVNQKSGGSRYNLLGLILSRNYQVEGPVALPEFSSLPISGVTSLRRNCEDLGRVGFHAISGQPWPGHSHRDKGSFILDAGGKSLLVDRGTCNYYNNIFATVIYKSEVHNMVTAVKDGLHLTQLNDKFDITAPRCANKYSGDVLKSEYENGELSYVTDVTRCWGGVFEKNVRSIQSRDPHEYWICDSLKIEPAYEVCFILNTYGQITRVPAGADETQGYDYLITDGDIQVRVHTHDWQPDREEIGFFGIDSKNVPVNRLCLYKGGQREYELTTRLLVERVTE